VDIEGLKWFTQYNDVKCKSDKNNKTDALFYIQLNTDNRDIYFYFAIFEILLNVFLCITIN
jgi:hypothetical protein